MFRHAFIPRLSLSIIALLRMTGNGFVKDAEADLYLAARVALPQEP